MPDIFTVFLNKDDDDNDDDDDEIRRPPPSPPPSHRVSSPTLPFCFWLAAIETTKDEYSVGRVCQSTFCTITSNSESIWITLDYISYNTSTTCAPHLLPPLRLVEERAFTREGGQGLIWPCTETGINHLWLRMARIKMDCKVKKKWLIFSSSSCVFSKIAKTDLLWRNHSIFFPRCSKGNFMLEKRFSMKYLSSFNQQPNQLYCLVKGPFLVTSLTVLVSDRLAGSM